MHLMRSSYAMKRIFPILKSLIALQKEKLISSRLVTKSDKATENKVIYLVQSRSICLDSISNLLPIRIGYRW